MNDRNFSRNRLFYDFLLMELVCSVYAREFHGLNRNLLLPSYRRLAKGRAQEDCYRRIGDVLSEGQIQELDNVVTMLRAERPGSLPLLKSRLLELLPGLTYCHLDRLSHMEGTIRSRR